MSIWLQFASIWSLDGTPAVEKQTYASQWLAHLESAGVRSSLVTISLKELVMSESFRRTYVWSTMFRRISIWIPQCWNKSSRELHSGWQKQWPLPAWNLSGKRGRRRCGKSRLCVGGHALQNQLHANLIRSKSYHHSDHEHATRIKEQYIYIYCIYIKENQFSINQYI